MVIRIWRGWTRAEDAATYRDYMTRVALPAYAGVDGNIAVYMTHRRDGEREEFAMITVWESIDAVRDFAGDDPERAVFYPHGRRLPGGPRVDRAPLRRLRQPPTSGAWDGDVGPVTAR